MINQDTTERIAGDLKSLRIQSGDVILVHSSLKSLQLSYDSFIRCGNVLKAQTFVIESQGLKMAVVSKLRENPCYFVDKY